jgi:hypothetical protein
VTLARYLAGVLLTVIAIAPVCAGVYALRARKLPHWRGPPARLAEAVLGLALVIGVSEALGTVGLFRLAPMVVALGSVGTALWYAVRRVNAPMSGSRLELASTRMTVGPKGVPRAEAEPRASHSAEASPNRLGSAGLVVALVATAVVVAEWGTRTIASFHHGMETVDTLWYHLPTAARFVQEGSITGLHYADPGPVVVFFPALCWPLGAWDGRSESRRSR